MRYLVKCIFRNAIPGNMHEYISQYAVTTVHTLKWMIKNMYDKSEYCICKACREESGLSCIVYGADIAI